MQTQAHGHHHASPPMLVFYLHHASPPMLKLPPSPPMLHFYLRDLRFMATTMHHHQCCIFICVISGSWAPPCITTNAEFLFAQIQARGHHHASPPMLKPPPSPPTLHFYLRDLKPVATTITTNAEFLFTRTQAYGHHHASPPMHTSHMRELNLMPPPCITTNAEFLFA